VEAQMRSEPSTYFFDPPVMSYDDRYIVVESSFASDAFDSYLGNTQPEHARLVLYDRSDHEVIEEIRGIDPVWSH
jgi:hypothetical protein